MDKLSYSYYGWTFSRRDFSQKAAQEYPRDEMLMFKRLGINQGMIVIENISVPRFGFMEAIDNLEQQLKTKMDIKLRLEYEEFSSLRRQVDHALCDII